MNNQFFFRFIIIEMFVFEIIIKYIRSTFEFRDVERLERRIDSRDLKKQINRFLNQKMNSIIAFNAWKKKQQLHEKIIIYENFIQMKYFDQLKELDWSQGWVSDMSNSPTRFNPRVEQKFLFDGSSRILAIVRRSNPTREIVRNLRLDKIR
jgi:hypothetical protein